jgi:hypothetical protein
LFLSPTGRLNLGVIIDQNLLLCSSHLSLGVPNWAASTANKHFSGAVAGDCRRNSHVNHAPSKHFSGAIAGDKEDFWKGSLSLPIFYFVIVLLTFFTLFLLASFIKNTKKLVPFIVGISLILLLVQYVVP